MQKMALFRSQNRSNKYTFMHARTKLYFCDQMLINNVQSVLFPIQCTPNNQDMISFSYFCLNWPCSVHFLDIFAGDGNYELETLPAVLLLCYLIIVFFSEHTDNCFELSLVVQHFQVTTPFFLMTYSHSSANFPQSLFMFYFILKIAFENNKGIWNVNIFQIPPMVKLEIESSVHNSFLKWL